MNSVSDNLTNVFAMACFGGIFVLRRPVASGGRDSCFAGRNSRSKWPGGRFHACLAALFLLALSAQSYAADAPPGLLELLRQKAILSEQEYQHLHSLPAAEANLSSILRDKGVLSAAEFDRLAAGSAAPGPVSAATAPAPVEGVALENRAGGFKVKLSGRVHADFRSYKGPPVVNRTVDTTEARRVRLGAEFEYDDWLGAEITGDFAATSKVDTAYINYRFVDAAQLRIGLFKMPFSLEELTSSNYIDFQERSLANAQAPGKERGIMIHGRPFKGLYYGLALSNGNGGADTDENNGKDRIGRVAANLAEWTGNMDAVLHFGVGGTSGTRSVGDVGFEGRSEARGFRFFDPAAFTGTSVDIERRGIETALAWGPFKLQGERVTSRFEGINATGVAYNREIAAHYLSGHWLITGENYADAYKNGAFGSIRPESDFHPRHVGRGAVELGLRYSKLDASDFTLTNPVGSGVLGAGLTNGADAWTIGLKWILNRYGRVMLNLIRTRYDTPVLMNGSLMSKESAITLRGQVNF